MKNLTVFLIAIVFLSSFLFAQNSVQIREFSTLSVNSTRIVLGRQVMVRDNNSDIHLFFGTYGETADTIYHYTSSDNGLSWEGPEVISIFTHSSSYDREHIRDISAAVDENNNLHVIYRYDGPPYYLSGWDAYPPSHINYVKKVDGVWTTFADVINDEAVQTEQGNGSTVCYLFNSQLMKYNSDIHYIASDYAWWGTKYNIVYSNNSSGEWLQGEALRTYDLGVYDNIMLNAPSLAVNNDTLFTLWYQRYDCKIEMKKFDGSNWSDVETVFNDSYFPAPNPTSYNVRTGSVQQNEQLAVTSMLRYISADDDELLVLSKKQNSGWQIDTTWLDVPYTSVEPTISADTTYIYLFGNSAVTGRAGCFVKYTQTDGFLEFIPMFLQDTTELLVDLKSLNDASVPFVYVTLNSENVYFLKVGMINSLIDDVEDPQSEAPKSFELSQNYPNPFNPTTTIKYSIPANTGVETQDFASLRIYNILGEEVATLVNEKQSPGNYTVQFDASNLPSGVYFYTLRTGNFVATKKMILLK